MSGSERGLLMWFCNFFFFCYRWEVCLCFVGCEGFRGVVGRRVGVDLGR